MKAIQEKNVFFVILLVVTAVSVLVRGSYAIPAFLEFVSDDSYEDEFLMADLGGFALAVIVFILLVICFRTKRRNLLLPAAALFVIDTVFLDGYAAPVCCAVLCLMAFLQERDERSGLVPAAAVLLYVVMLFFWVGSMLPGISGDIIDLMDDEFPIGWYYTLPLVLLITAIILMIRGMKRKRAVWMKWAAGAYLLQEALAMVSTIFAYGFDSMITDSFTEMGLALLTWIFGSPAILISLYLIFRKTGDAHELKTDTD